MLHSYYGFVETEASREPDLDSEKRTRPDVFGDFQDDNSLRQLSRELLASKDLFRHGSEYFVMERRLRKLMENRNDSLSQENAAAFSFSGVLGFSASGPVLLNCRDIEAIEQKEYIASGWTKAVFRGVYGDRRVALKTVDIGGQDVTSCVDSGYSLQHCYQRAAHKIVKEIVLLQALAHDNVIQVRNVP